MRLVTRVLPAMIVLASLVGCATQTPPAAEVESGIIDFICASVLIYT